MKKCITVFSFILLTSITITAMAQTPIQKITKVGDKLHIEENGNKFSVDRKIVIAKPQKALEKSSFKYKIVHKEEFGHVVIEVPEGKDIQNFVKTLRMSNLFESVDYISEVKCYWTPNDPLLHEQPFINKLNLPIVWDITKGNPNIKVAIIDTGVDRDHPDLGYGYGNYTNVSYTLGWDYKTNTQYHAPHDDGSHGTEIAGLIGAKTNNIHGVAGISGGNNSSGITMMSYRVIEKDGDKTSSIGSAIKKAVDQGANIIYLSIGQSYTPAVVDALNYAHTHNVVVICATGNEGIPSIAFPASYETTIAVGESSTIDKRDSKSNYGAGLNLLAPAFVSRTTSLDNNYFLTSGTSMAAALVSGTVALMLSKNPSLTPTKVRDILQCTATKVSGYSYNDNGWNNEVGYGVLNTFAAVLTACNMQFLETSTICPGSSSTFSLNNLPSGLTVQWSISDGSGPPAPTIQKSGNLCTITNNLSMLFTGKLNAKVYKNGNLLATLTKELILAPDFYGRYTSDNLSGTIDYTHIFNVKPGVSTVITSPNLIGASVSYDHTGTTPSSFSLDSSQGKLFMVMPANNGGKPIIINIADACGNHYQLYAIPQGSYHLNISYEGSNINISLNEDAVATKSLMHDQLWSYEIRSATMGDLKTSKKVNSRSTTISTTGWPKGIYIIKAIIGKEEATEKIVVK